MLIPPWKLGMRPAPWGHLLDWIRDQTAPIRTGQNEYGGPSRASPLDANWINLGTIRAWRDHKCTEYPKFGSPPTWLIDVRKGCLVSPAQLRGEARYCALSYVWGQVETGKLTTETREAFCRPGAFSARSPSPVVIPKTIRHAMGLVKELGERYLWVDSLCIVQDQDTGHELANMGAIYDRATLTIVAATAWDADGGLRGLRGISGPRHLSAFGDDMSEYLDPDSMIWNSRAWTFQEGQFSRRMLIFCDQTVIWKCLCRCTDEVGTDLAAQGSRGSSLAHVNHLLRGKVNRGQRFELSNLLLRGVANRGQRPEDLFDEYCQTLVSPYNTRNCTRTADFPRAFEGIVHALAKTAVPGTLFSQGFCWGLPIAFLPHALTWCAAELNLRPRDQLLGFPSFSWLAWEGRIKLKTIMECEPWYVENFQSNPQARCHWDIVYPKSTSKQNSVRASGDAPRTAMKIKGEICHFEAGQFRMRYGNTTDEPGQLVYNAFFEPGPMESFSKRRIALYPDQVNGMLAPASSDVYLVGISTFREQNWDGEGERKSFVKAIWVTRCDEDIVLTDKPVPSFRRVGVAIVNIFDWDGGTVKGEELGEIVLE